MTTLKLVALAYWRSPTKCWTIAWDVPRNVCRQQWRWVSGDIARCRWGVAKNRTIGEKALR